MDKLVYRTPSVGSVVKKVLAINPDLNVQQTIEIIRQSVQTQTQHILAEEFLSAEVVNEAIALDLARATLKNS
jgi:hypothetical protein